MESYGSEDYISECHSYVENHLEIDIEKEYALMKAEWVYLSKPLVVVCLSGDNPFRELAETRRAFFVKENSDYGKCMETMLDRSLNKLVLVNFTKEENRIKLMSLFEEWPKEIVLSTVFLFKDPRFYETCPFKKAIKDYGLIEIEERRTPSKQLAAVLERNVR